MTCIRSVSERRIDDDTTEVTIRIRTRRLNHRHMLREFTALGTGDVTVYADGTGKVLTITRELHRKEADP